MHDIIPTQSYGPIRLGISKTDIAKLLGPASEVINLGKDRMLEPETRAFYRGVTVENRSTDELALELIDTVFSGTNLVAINVNGRSRNARLLGEPINGDRMGLLSRLATVDTDILINSESYYFRTLAIEVSRAKTRKDINYLTVRDPSFYTTERQVYDMFKPHKGPLIR